MHLIGILSTLNMVVESELISIFLLFQYIEGKKLSKISEIKTKSFFRIWQQEQMKKKKSVRAVN